MVTPVSTVVRTTYNQTSLLAELSWLDKPESKSVLNIDFEHTSQLPLLPKVFRLTETSVAGRNTTAMKLVIFMVRESLPASFAICTISCFSAALICAISFSATALPWDNSKFRRSRSFAILTSVSQDSRYAHELSYKSIDTSYSI